MKRKKRRAKRQANKALGVEPESDALQMMEDVLTDFSVDELREFLEADLVDVQVDPEFKERLRTQLWDLLQSRNDEPGGDREPN